MVGIRMCNPSSVRLLHRLSVLGLLSIFGYSCSQPPDQRTNMAVVSPNSEAVKFQVPAGDEIRVAIQHYGHNRAVLTVENVSSETVFVPFLPTEDGSWSKLGCEGLEMYDMQTNKYREISCSIAGLGYHALGSQKSLKYLIWVTDSGRYRASFKYYRDPRIVNLLNSFNILSDSEKEELRRQSEKAAGQVVSPPIKL